MGCENVSGRCDSDGMVGPSYPGMNASWHARVVYEANNAKAKRYYLAGKMFKCPSKVHNPAEAVRHAGS